MWSMAVCVGKVLRLFTVYSVVPQQQYMATFLGWTVSMRACVDEVLLP